MPAEISFAMECWICLSGEESRADSLDSSYCGCADRVRPVHKKCLGRWQLQRAGTREETHCRFCNSKYQLDWRTSLASPTEQQQQAAAAPGANGRSSSTPASATAAAAAAPERSRPRAPTPIMAIIFEGQVHRIKVYPGPEGKARFQQQIRELVQLGDDEEFEVEFECKAPDSGAVLHLDGMDAFDAATHCASLTAAERLTRQQQQSSSAGSGPESALQHSQHRSRSRSGSRRQQRVSADVQLQVAAQHSAADSCPHSTAQHGSAAARGARRAGR